MGSRFLYVAIFGFTVGIFIHSFFPLSLPTLVWILTVCFVLGLVWRRKSNAFSPPYLLLVILFCTLFACGALRMEVGTWTFADDLYRTQVNQNVTVEGIVIAEPDVRGAIVRLSVLVDEIVLLVTTDRNTLITYGDTVSVTGKLTEPKTFETDLGRTFNYKGYLHARGISYTIPYGDVSVLEHGGGNFVIAKLLSVKQQFMEKIVEHIPQPQAGLSLGLLLGVKQALGDDLENAFRTTGITHIVVLSGYNMMLVVAFITTILSFVVASRIRLFVCAIAIVLFACMVGLSATVLRACAMALLLLLAQATSRTYLVLRILVLVGALMLLHNPYLLVYDVGFQFSFIATFGLIILSPLLLPYVSFMPKTFGLREFLTATVATQVFITPILLYHMGTFSVVSVVVNVLVLPLVPVAMLLTFTAGLVSFVSATAALPFAYSAYICLSYIISIAETFASFPFASLAIPAFPFWVVIVSYLFFAGVLYKMYTRKKENVNSPTQDFSDWTIVDEEALKLSLQLSAQNNDHAVPSFFR